MHRQALRNVEELLVLKRVNPRCVHVVDLGLNRMTDEHHMTATFHPDPTCPGLLRGGRADDRVDSSRLEHSPRGIPLDALRIAIPADDHRARPEAGGGDDEVYELTGFTHNPPAWVCTTRSTA